MNVFVSHGNVADSHEDELIGASIAGASERWTINGQARRGDVVVFYITRPRSAFVAWGKVKTKPKMGRSRWGRGGRAYWSDIGPVHALGRACQLRDAREALPEWTWLTTAQSPTQVPDAISARLLGLLGIEPDAGSAQATQDDSDNNADRVPRRASATTTRIIRDTELGRRLKRSYDFACQICSITLVAPTGPYAEVHHLRPLGAEHRGTDSWRNMIVVCPNCHVRLDLLITAIQPGTNILVERVGRGAGQAGHVRFIHGHVLDRKNVEYHWKRFVKAKRQKGGSRWDN